MEFSYQISEDEYVRAYKLAAKSKRPALVKTVLFWAFVIICLTLLFGVISKQRHSPGDSEVEQAPVTQQAPAGNALLVNLGPLALVFAGWGFLFFFWIPNAVRRQYRKDTNSHGTITIHLDVESIAIRSTVGTSTQSRWNVYNGWQEKQDIVILRYPNGTFQFLNIAGLSEPERAELRGILATALPRMK